MKLLKLAVVVIVGAASMGWSDGYGYKERGIILPAAPRDPQASVRTQLSPEELAHFMALAKKLIIANGNPPRALVPGISVGRYNLVIEGHYQEDGSFQLLGIMLKKKAKFMETMKSDFADSKFEIKSDGKIDLEFGDMATLQNPEVQAILQKHLAVWMGIDPESIVPPDQLKR